MANLLVIRAGQALVYPAESEETLAGPEGLVNLTGGGSGGVLLDHKDTGKPSPWRWVLFVVAAMALAGGTYAVGWAVRGNTVTDLKAEISDLKISGEALEERLMADLDTARGEVAERSQAVREAAARATTLSGEVEALRTQVRSRDREVQSLRANIGLVADLQAKVEALTSQVQGVDGGDRDLGQIREVADGLSRDRLLIAEMRKPLPPEREEAERFWTSVKAIAVKSDSSLASKADKITVALPAYFDWSERGFSSTQESAITYILTGANAYEASVDEFWGAVLLVVIDRIDALTGLVGFE